MCFFFCDYDSFEFCYKIKERKYHVDKHKIDFKKRNEGNNNKRCKPNPYGGISVNINIIVKSSVIVSIDKIYFLFRERWKLNFAIFQVKQQAKKQRKGNTNYKHIHSITPSLAYNIRTYVVLFFQLVISCFPHCIVIVKP